MLVPFAIDPVALSFDPLWTPSQRQDYHESLLENWGRIGLLVHSGETLTETQLFQAIDALPQKQKMLWLEALKKFPICPVGVAWDGKIKASVLSDLSEKCDVAIVDDATSEVEFGFCEDELSRLNVLAETIEVCRFIAANKANSFKTAAILCGAHIQAGETYQNIWNIRFKRLALAPLKRISIVDRFAISQHFNCPQSHLSGMERFLRLLAQDCDGARHVTLYSAWTGELGNRVMKDVEDELKTVMQRLPTKNVKRLKIVMAPNTSFTDLAHDRFVRFEDYVWDIGLGLRVFEGPACCERSSASFKGGANAGDYRQIESDLGNDPRVKSADIYC